MNPDAEIATTLARVVFLMRNHPADRESQKAAFRALLAQLGGKPLALGASDTHTYVGGQPVDNSVVGAPELRGILLSHGVGELKTQPGLAPAQLLTVVRALVAPPGTYPRLQNLADHFGGRGVPNVHLAPPVPVRLPESGSVPQRARQSMAPPGKPGEPAEEGELSELGPGAASEDTVGLLHFVTLEMQSVGKLDEVLLTLDRDPTGSGTLDLLNEVVALADMSAQKEEWDNVLRAAAALVRLEERLEDDAMRRACHIALRRVVTKTVLEQLVWMTTSAEFRGEATLVLRRIGADATEALLQRLIAAAELSERRAYYSALSQMREGTGLLVHMLGHDEWYVIRNSADLCGELKVEQAVPTLTRQLAHRDERVRRAVAGALAKIGTPATVEPLRKALTDPEAGVRLTAAGSIEGEGMKGLVPVLARLVGKERNNDARYEMLRALGRIGTPEAIQALGRLAQPGGSLFRRRPAALRLAAVEALKSSGLPEARTALEALQGDKDDDIRNAVSRALA
ncbi:MAG: HEAT repeat domain-containing protein [Gemmatimonadales bacterium]